MSFEEKFNTLWATKSDKETAVSIRSESEDLWNRLNDIIQTINDNSNIDIDAEIKSNFVDLRTSLVACKSELQDFIDTHPEFIDWRP